MAQCAPTTTCGLFEVPREHLKVCIGRDRVPTGKRSLDTKSLSNNGLYNGSVVIGVASTPVSLLF